MSDIYLTEEGYQKLVEDLARLKTVKRRQLSKAIGEARDHGDISENAEYDAAKEEQAFNEKKISELEAKLACARILNNEDIPKDRVLVGATVEIRDLDTEEKIVYMLVSEAEADYKQGKISISSPVGKGLMNRKEEETVEIKIPAGTLRYKVLKISR
ncbi:MAG: transcription elongation factor GreA [Candidatus Omnitrophota bacterium]|jgi:transcription elongation factor GreA